MTTPTKTEVAMQNLMDVFHEYAKKDKHTLNKLQMKQFMETELGQLCKNKKNVESFDKMMKDLDFDGDGEVNFEEFVSFVAGVMFSCNEIYVKRKEQQAKEEACQLKK
ncbi:protein S100-A11-like [Stegostoma tigrinum]|uniref:protein S100-A11-like n=1 Tax=Stegostoma tigrinum TaxID=3053191 RepID=UPI00202B7DD6|nr:protein S100-A11-like [Stegostoma tigrinum]